MTVKVKLVFEISKSMNIYAYHEIRNNWKKSISTIQKHFIGTKIIFQFFFFVTLLIRTLTWVIIPLVE